MRLPLGIYINALLFLISQFGRSSSQQHGRYPVTDASGNEVPPWNRPSIEPGRPDNRQNSRPPRRPCAETPCQNSGTCTETSDSTFTCECRPLYLGDRCQVVVKPPAKLKAESIEPDRIKVIWLPPNGTRPIHGYMVQHNKFGERTINQSHHIPPGTLHYTIKGLEEATQYVVCINTIFDNETIPTDAILRDQCIEVMTVGGGTSDSLILIIVIGAVVIATLLLLLTLLLCCNRRQSGEEKPEGGAFPSVSWRRTRDNGNYQDRSYLTDTDTVEARYTNEELSYHQNQTNNASRSSYNEDEVFKKRLSAGQKPQYLNDHLLAVRSVSVTDHPSAILNPLRAETRSHSSGSAHNIAAHNQKQANRLSNVLSASYRELPPSISNHMMRSPTSRDKDATDEFDIGGSYFAPRHS